MNFKNITMILLIAVGAIQPACKGKKGDIGPAGTTDRNIGLSDDGSYIKGTITTTTSTGKPVSFTFNHNHSSSYNYYGGNASYTSVELYKSFSSIPIINGNDKAFMEFILDSIADPTPASPYIKVYATSVLSADSTFNFYIDGTPTITNYMYDASTRTASGNYTMTNTNTTNSNSGTVTGSFKFMNLKTVVYRQGNK
jgi:hypothetical protein